MTALMILLCFAIFIPGCVKLSIMPLRMSLAWALMWGVAAFFITLLFSNLARGEVYALISIREISTLEFIELSIMLAYLFTEGIWKKILGYYPGLMTIVPISMVALLFTGLFPGMAFSMVGLIAGIVTAVAIAGVVLMLRYARADERTLYFAVLVSVLSDIIIFGLL